MPMMKKVVPAADPDAYVAALDGWRRKVVTDLRASARSVAGLDEAIKWGHIVYSANGPVLLIRAEDSRVLFGFWRGQRLTEIEPRLKGGGMYEMASLDLREGMSIAPATAKRLVKEALALDKSLGDARLAAKSPARKRVKGTK